MVFILERIAHVWYQIARDPDSILPVILILALVDVWSAYLWMARLRKGHGASGVMAVSWIFYTLLILFTREPILFQRKPAILFKFIDFAILTAFHALCHFVVPALYRKWLERQDRRMQRKQSV